MLEKENQFKNFHPLKELMVEKESLEQNLKIVTKEKETYSKLSSKTEILIIIGWLILFTTSWTSYLFHGLPISKQNILSFFVTFMAALSISIVLSAIMSVYSARAIFYIKKRTAKGKLLLKKVTQLNEDIKNVDIIIEKSFQEKQTRFDILWYLESVFHNTEKKYPKNFIQVISNSIKNIQTSLEKAYLMNDITTIKKNSDKIYLLPEAIEQSWIQYESEEKEKSLHLELKSDYVDYLKEKGKTVFNPDTITHSFQKTL